MSSSENSAVGDEVQAVFVAEEYVSSEEPPEDQWSSLICMQHGPDINIKRELYDQGLYDIGSGEVCTKYITLSRSSLFRHPYYKYPCVLDPGIDDALFKTKDKVKYDLDGQELYLAVCEEMSEFPIKLFHRSLLGKVINLKYYCVSSSGIRPIAMALELNPHVKVLDLTDSFIDADACYHLGVMLETNNTLEELILAGCRIGGAGLNRILTGCMMNDTIKFINFNRNEIGDNGFKYLVQAIENRLKLPKIGLSSNQLTSTSAHGLAEALEFNNRLVYVDLSWNNMCTPTGMCHLLSFLSYSEYLQEMNLSWNALAGARVGLAIKAVLKANNLVKLDLSNNKLEGEAITNMLPGVSAAVKLTTLNMSNNPISPSEALLFLNKVKLKSSKIQNLYLDHVYVDTHFTTLLKSLKRVKAKKNVVVTHGDVIADFKAKGPDVRELVLNRAEFLCTKGKVKVDIALIIMQLVKDKFTIISSEDFQAALKANSAPLDAGLIDELVNTFSGPKAKKSKTIDLLQLLDYVKRKWPDRHLPPTPPPEPEPPPLPEKSAKKGKKK